METRTIIKQIKSEPFVSIPDLELSARELGLDYVKEYKDGKYNLTIYADPVEEVTL
ncbi:hypothetical protein [Geomicrobium sp. JCM 19055]|uniref:hypothetical protein n=1 Tax=Geomicrobium sp. JCM 19055 TaxID=1460649 RepID=UPI00045ED355|nr:hypothetical protein [Geomicrobium sp. JCM 19055]GAK00924.1 hypothetical protein JCM19055_4051 [Geomicrobium sp. JCM 19055]